jgi:peptidoglycan glycosyltransferase
VNKKLQHLGIFLVICFLAVTVKLHMTQLVEVQALAEKPDNNRETQRKLNQPRGKIFSADGALLADSLDIGGNNVTRKRVYPEGDLFGHITGYFSGRFKKEGVEQTYDRQLAGDTLRQQFDGLTNLFAARENVGHVTLSVRKDLQQLARDELGDREGAVTVLDPRTGAILAMWSNPSYNPELISQNANFDEDNAAKDWWALYQLNTQKPMLSKAFRERYQPGSTFKSVTAATGLVTGKVTTERPVYPQLSFITWPDSPGQPFANFSNEVCGGNLAQIMTVSCNTSFMQMGVDVGLPALDDEAKAFGFLQNVPIDLPNPAQSTVPTDKQAEGIAGTAQTAIGQKETSATPLQMAMVMAAVANGGTLMKPHVMRDVRNQDATVVETYKPEPWLTPLSPEQASTLRTVLYGPVNNPGGTATGRINLPSGMIAGGKTGTAQTGKGNAPLHTWFVGFAGPVGQAPTVAISVVVLRQQNRGESTGGVVAGPIANTMLNKALQVVDQKPADPRGAIVSPTTSVVPPGPFAGTPTTR